MTSDALTLGSFLLTDPSGSAWKAGVEAEGTTRGAPVPIEQAINTFLQDGSIVVTQGYDNREVNIRVRMWATSLTALSSAEAALNAELGKPNKLTWTPTSGPAAVFVVITSSMVQDDQTGNADLLASQRLIRSYNIRLLCSAFTQSATETLTSALAATGTTTTLVNDGSATTNWTGAVTAGVLTGPTVVSGAVKVGTTTAIDGACTVSSTYTAAITTSATKYLQIDWKPESLAGLPTLRAYGDGTELLRVAQIVSPTAGFTRSTFYVAAASIAVLRLDSYSNLGAAYGDSSQQPVIRSLYVDNINRTDIKPAIGTGRQLLRTIAVGGSARAQGSIAVEHASSSLGDTLVYFFPDGDNGQVTGYSPPLRQYRVSGGTVTTDATMVSGAKEPLTGGGAPSYGVPASKLLTGSHILMCRLLSSTPVTAATINWVASMAVGASSVGPSITGSTTVTLSTAYGNYALTRLNLPTSDVSTDLQSTILNLTLNATSTATVTLDEVWLFNTSIGQLTQVACGTGAAASGGPARRLFMEPATTARPRPTIRIGHAADRSDAFYPVSAIQSVSAWQFPVLSPPRVNVFTVTSNALDVDVSLRNFNRWHSNPAT